jgi:hypothetical protein
VKLLVSLWLAVLLCGGTGNSQLFNDAPGTPAEKEIDSAQMRQIWKALMAYVADKGQTPDYLSDLVPEYLPDKSVLVSPAHRRTGMSGDNGHVDPKLPASYCYEFSARKFFNSPRSFRDLKNAQMQEFGAVVPILRCFLYPKVLNVGYGGDVYETELYWESAPATQELLKQHGLGSGFKEGEFCRLTVEDAVSGKPIANCEVKLTNRVYHGLDLPNRVLTTDDEGVAQVPLGPGDHSMRRVQITATAPGYEKKMEMWTSNSFKEEATLRLKTADQRDRVPASPAAPEPKP